MREGRLGRWPLVTVARVWDAPPEAGAARGCWLLEGRAGVGVACSPRGGGGWGAWRAGRVARLGGCEVGEVGGWRWGGGVGIGWGGLGYTLQSRRPAAGSTAERTHTFWI